jgi:hypothetical protein
VILNNWLRRYRAGAALCRFCPRSWNRVANVLESIEGVGCRIEKTENGWGWQIIVDGTSDYEPPSGFEYGWDRPRRLGCTLSGATLTVSAGSVRFHGVGTAAVAETEIECAMSPMWVYVKVARASLVATVEAMSSEPDSDYVNLYLPLAVVEGADGAWSITEICHEGDFDFDLPLR